jgi:hypothetical protein
VSASAPYLSLTAFRTSSSLGLEPEELGFVLLDRFVFSVILSHSSEPWSF